MRVTESKEFEKNSSQSKSSFQEEDERSRDLRRSKNTYGRKWSVA